MPTRPPASGGAGRHESSGREPRGRRRERASLVVVEGGRILTVALEDPTTRTTRLFPPGGMVEPGEDPATCAVRETLEETGYRAVVDAGSRLTLDYDFVWDGKLVPCRTHFFRGRLAEPGAAPQPVRDAVYNRGAVWISRRELDAVFAYDATIAAAVAKLATAPDDSL